MSSTRTDRPTRSPFGAPKDDGPRASLRQLLPYLAEHRGILAIVVLLSILAAGASLAQPVLVSQVITVVQAGEALGMLVWALIGLVVASVTCTGPSP